jgi:hypothetical protein
MKIIASGVLKRSSPLLLWLVWTALPVAAQDAKLRLDSLNLLESKAAEIVDVAVDERMLRLASKVLSPKRSSDEAKIKELIAGLKGVYVKVFRFDRSDDYAPADLADLRAQFRAPGWTRILDVRSKRGGDNIEVHVMTDGDNITGVGIIAAEARELTVINIVGPIDLEKLSELEGHFGIPDLDLQIRWRKE